MKFQNGMSANEFVNELENALDKTSDVISEYIGVPEKENSNDIDSNEIISIKDATNIVPSLQIFLMYHGFVASTYYEAATSTAMLNYAFGKVYPNRIYHLGEQLCAYEMIVNGFDISEDGAEEDEPNLFKCNDLEAIANSSLAMSQLKGSDTLVSLIKASDYASGKIAIDG